MSNERGPNGAQRLRERFGRWARGTGERSVQSTPQSDAQTTADTHFTTQEPEDTMNDERYTDTTTAEAPEAEFAPDGTSAAAPTLKDFEQLSGERDALRDRLARLQAEFDNARKREVKERQDARDYAVQSTVEPFLSVMDNFALALRSGGSAEQLRTGVELILKQMDEALRTLNVQAVDAVGTQFDPRVHEALGSVETPEHPDNQVLEEIRRGYRLRDKLLRPALVRIASNPHQVNE